MNFNLRDIRAVVSLPRVAEATQAETAPEQAPSIHPQPSTLADLREGNTATLAALHLPPRTAEHLMWLGFVPGAEVTVGPSGPGGDPRVYLVSGTAFAMRRETARNLVLVRASHGAQA